MQLSCFRSHVLVAILMAGLLGVGSLQAEDAQTQKTPAEAYGEPLSPIEVTPIEAILADPEAWNGKTVRIEGRVGDVCPRKGCWMDLVASEDGSEGGQLRVKVEDGVIVFPVDSSGSLAEAEGVVSVMEMSREHYIGWLAHLAEEKGEELDPATVGDGPFQMVQVMGVGARLTRP